MSRADDIRDVFCDPQPGDVILYFRETYNVIEIERHPGKNVVVVQIESQHNRTKRVSTDSWREYREDAQVLVNKSVIDAFE